MFILIVLICVLAASCSDYVYDTFEKNILARMDKNQDGVVTLYEFEDLFTAGDHTRQITPHMLTSFFRSVGTAFLGQEGEIFKIMDHDSNGVINYEDVDVTFRLFDSNLDHVIDPDEFHGTFRLVVGHVSSTQRRDVRYQIYNQQPQHEEI